MIRRLVIAALFVLTSLPAFAVNPDEMLPDPALEARAREISSHLRCLVCQNQSIDDSNAELARDLRLLVRDRLKAGATDQQVYDYVVSRYGEFVLLKPRLSEHTIILWGAPIGLLVAGLLALGLMARSRAGRRVGGPSLSAQEQAKIDMLMKNGDI
jgi:cytochrome c-type biogenesis protein CcmH